MVAALTACLSVLGTLVDQGLVESAARPDPGRPAFAWHVLTGGPERIELRHRGPGRIALLGARGTVRSGADHNRRQILTRAGGGRSIDQTTCATWASQSSRAAQQGLAVRVRSDGRRERAVTLTKNTFANYFWVFNLVTWDTDRPGDPWRSVRQFDMSRVVVRGDRLAPLPWRVCLRVRGRQAAFKVWLPRREDAPSWRDPVHVRRTRLPSEFVLRGAPGWYVGHLAAGARVEYAGLGSAVGR